MRVILSPAKKMTVDTDSLPWRDLPRFLPEAQALCQVLQGMSEAQLKALWKCNDQIAQLNVDRLRQMDLHTRLTPAVLAYQGLQYQYMAPGVFTIRGCNTNIWRLGFLRMRRMHTCRNMCGYSLACMDCCGRWTG